MKSYFCPPRHFLRPLKCCKNHLEPGIKWLKHSLLNTRAKNGHVLRINISTVTVPLMLRFEWQMSKEVISRFARRFFPNSQFWLSYQMIKMFHNWCWDSYCRFLKLLLIIIYDIIEESFLTVIDLSGCLCWRWYWYDFHTSATEIPNDVAAILKLNLSTSIPFLIRTHTDYHCYKCK